MFLRYVVPLFSTRLRVSLPCDQLMERLKQLVPPESRSCFDYLREGRGFSGTVKEDRFRLRRSGRKHYIPWVIGHVLQDGNGCAVSLRFVALDGIIVPSVLLLTMSAAALYNQLGVALFAGVLLAVAHIPGCIQFQQEIEAFLEAAGISTQG
jgi:hypothetical protein